MNCRVVVQLVSLGVTSKKMKKINNVDIPKTKKGLSFNCCTLKGQCHEMFCHFFIS